MQYTIRNIPSPVDAVLRSRATKDGKSLNEVVIDALRRGTDTTAEPLRHRDLRDVAGSWVEDPDFDAAIQDQHRVDSHLWE